VTIRATSPLRPDAVLPKGSRGSRKAAITSSIKRHQRGPPISAVADELTRWGIAGLEFGYGYGCAESTFRIRVGRVPAAFDWQRAPETPRVVVKPSHDRRYVCRSLSSGQERDEACPRGAKATTQFREGGDRDGAFSRAPVGSLYPEDQSTTLPGLGFKSGCGYLKLPVRAETGRAEREAPLVGNVEYGYDAERFRGEHLAGDAIAFERGPEHAEKAGVVIFDGCLRWNEIERFGRGEAR
jgi:hypothetical protein